MNLEQFLDQVRATPDIMSNITRWVEIPEREAVFADFPEGIDRRIVTALERHGIRKLYSHQALAVKEALENRDFVVVTPTASGKTLCYNIPVINSILRDQDARAIFLFPTKALSQDQTSELHGIIEEAGVDIKTFTYDGDTPQSARRAIRQAGHIVVTNPDMLHSGILPHHTKWTRLFENLKYIVIDEIHHYRGVFGSHLANIMRRLLRICSFYGSNPTFICCSATIANPGELAGRITGREIKVIDQNGSPSGKKHMIFYNPPVVNRQLGIRKGSILETRRLADMLVRNNIQTIVFTRTRLNVEVLVTYLKDIFKGRPGAENRIRGYRGGYLPLERRAIERGLRKGEITGVVATNALELGIDIGSLEACVMCGYPGSIASTWQQAGRAGRRNSVAAAFLIAGSSPLDQYIVTNPDYFFGRSPENGMINPDNLVILYNHIKCAAFELPFEDGEKFGVETTGEILEYMEEARILHHVGGRWHWMSEVFPADEISLRSAANENFIIIDITQPGHKVIGEVDRFAAPMLIHEEAVYIHEGQQYQVEKLDWENKKAYVRKVDVDYYTDAHLGVELKVIDVFRQQESNANTSPDASCTSSDASYISSEANAGSYINTSSSASISPNVGTYLNTKTNSNTDINPAAKGVTKYCGEVKVTSIVTMFKKIKLYTHENIGAGPVDLPELEMHTTAYWVSLPDKSKNVLNSEAQDGLIGLTNILANVAPVYLMCDSGDIRVVHQTKGPFTQQPTVFIYDAYPGGVGFSEKLYELHTELYSAARDMVLSCGCEAGCPSCVGPQNEFSGRGNPKSATLQLLETIIGR